MNKDGENLRGLLKRYLRSADGLPAQWLAHGGLTVGGDNARLPSFPGAADKALLVVVLRALFMALPEHFRKAKGATDGNAADWQMRIGLSAEGACGRPVYACMC